MVIWLLVELTEIHPELAAQQLPRAAAVDTSSSLKAKMLRAEAQKSGPKRAKRLLALADIEDGQNVRSVAKRNSVSQQTVYNWIKCFREYGYDVFTQRIGRPHSKRYTSQEMGMDLKIAAQKMSGEDARKLLAVSQMLLKKRREDIAKEARVSFSALYKWMARFNDGGIEKLLESIRQRRFANRVKLRGDIQKCDILGAAACLSERSARRLLAITMLLDGKTLEEVADDLGMSKSSISKWRTRFNRGGVGSLVSKFDRYSLEDTESTL